MRMTKQEQFMNYAISEALTGLHFKHGGPFGSIVIRKGRVIGYGHNTVTSSKDPTAHAEINAIRQACTILDTFKLNDCKLYTSCEPCPLCIGAIYWSGIKKVYYSNTKEDAAKIGFDDKFIYD